MSGGGGQTVTQKADPWRGAQTDLRTLLVKGRDLQKRGGFAPEVFAGDRVAGFGDTSQMGQDMMIGAAQGPNATSSAQGFLGRMMDGGYQSDQLEQVKQNALGSAVPAATAMFSGSGMLNSSQAMDTVGRAAAEAVAPYEYGAFENAQARGLSAAGMAPQIDAAGYLPGQMMSSVGAAQDAMRQAEIDAEMAQFYEGANSEAKNLEGYARLALPISGQGGMSSSTQPGPSMLQTMGGSALGGLGTYGALAANPATAPYAMIGGLGAGLLGLL